MQLLRLLDKKNHAEDPTQSSAFIFMFRTTR